MKSAHIEKCAYSVMPCKKCPRKVKGQCGIRNILEELREKMERFERSLEVREKASKATSSLHKLETPRKE